MAKEISITAKDISIVIPTYNRPEDLEKTLNDLLALKEPIREIIVVDQSKDNKTKEVVKLLRSKKVKYVFSKTPAITIARNLGVKASKNSKLICFIDDDVTLGKNYFKEILKVFNEKPEALAVAGYTGSKKFNTLGLIGNFLKGVFFISHREKDKARIVSAYGNTYPPELHKVINSQWLPGVNMVYKKEVFKAQWFDEKLLGYTIAEDIDFSYRLYQKHPSSIFVTPFASLTHRSSQTGRYPTERMSYINQIDHFYFNYKNFNRSIRERVIFFWCLLGISFLRMLNLLSFEKKNYLKFKFFFKSLFYCLANLGKIKSGKLREFRK